jgi:erythromycin esterase
MQNQREVAALLRERALSFDDLAPLGGMLAGVRIVGVGEATHGTQEFFAVRRRLLEFLTVELGFNVLAIEASYSATRALNDYVVAGRGERSSALAGLGMVMWDVEEFAQVLDWLRAHNASLADPEKKVRLCGLDILNTRAGRDDIVAFLRAVAPTKAGSAQKIFHAIATAEEHGVVEAHRYLSQDVLMELRGLAEFLAEEKETLVAGSSPAEHERAVDQLAVVLQFVAHNVTDHDGGDLPQAVPRKSGSNNFARSLYMARNMIRVIERNGPDARAMIWAHNFHLAVGFDDSRLGTVANMGSALRARFGAEYYVFGLELNRGRYLSREWQADRKPGDLKEGVIDAAPEGSLAWYLTQSGAQSLVLDLRSLAAEPALEEWLGASHPMHCISWASNPPLLTPVCPRRSFDGLIFIENTSPTTPTASALRTVAQRQGH